MTIVLSTPPYQEFADDSGAPLNGGLVYTYAAGTTTPLATYTDQGGLTQSANPIVLDSAGRAVWFLDNTVSYKYVVKTSAGVTIRTVDVVAPMTAGSGLSSLGNIASNTIVGNNTGSPTTPLALTTAQVITLLDISKVVVTTAQFDKTSDTTLANVTGLSVDVLAGTTYAFSAHLLTTTAATGGGIKLAIGGTATATRMDAYAWGGNGTAFAPLEKAPNVAIGAAIVNQVATTVITEIHGSIVVNAAGTLTVMFAQSSSSATACSVLIGSTFQVTKV